MTETTPTMSETTATMSEEISLPDRTLTELKCEYKDIYIPQWRIEALAKIIWKYNNKTVVNGITPDDITNYYKALEIIRLIDTFNDYVIYTEGNNYVYNLDFHINNHSDTKNKKCCKCKLVIQNNKPYLINTICFNENNIDVNLNITEVETEADANASAELEITHQRLICFECISFNNLFNFENINFLKNDTITDDDDNETFNYYTNYLCNCYELNNDFKILENNFNKWEIDYINELCFQINIKPGKRIITKMEYITNYYYDLEKGGYITSYDNVYTDDYGKKTSYSNYIEFITPGAKTNYINNELINGTLNNVDKCKCGLCDEYLYNSNTPYIYIEKEKELFIQYYSFNDTIAYEDYTYIFNWGELCINCFLKYDVEYILYNINYRVKNCSTPNIGYF